MPDSNYKQSELTEAIIGVFYQVYNELGFGFLESVYRNSMQIALEQKGFKVQAEVPITVFFRGQKVGDFKADLLVNDLVLLELKTAERIIPAYESQLVNYLRSTILEIGLILNFGPKPQIRRLIFENTRNGQRPTKLELLNRFISENQFD